MPCLVQLITNDERLKVQERIKAGAAEEDLAAYLNMPVERVKRMFRRDLALYTAEAKHEVLSKLFESAKSGNNTTAGIFWTKSRYGWRDAGVREGAAQLPWTKLKVEIDGEQPSAA